MCFIVISLFFLIDTLKAVTTKLIIDSQGLQISSLFSKYSKIPNTIKLDQSRVLMPWSKIKGIIYRPVLIKHGSLRGTYIIGWCKRVLIVFDNSKVMLTDLRNANELLKQCAFYISSDKIINETLDEKLNFKHNLSDYLRDGIALAIISGLIYYIWYLAKHQ